MTTVVVGVLWALWPLLALGGGLGFSTFTAFAAILLLPIAARSLRLRLYFLALLGFFVFAGVSMLWSPRVQEMISLDLEHMKIAVRSEMLRVGLPVLEIGILIAAAQRLGEAGKARLQTIAHIALILQLVILIVVTAFEEQLLHALSGMMSDSGEGVQNISRNCLIMAAAAPLLVIGLVRGRSFAIGGAIAALVLGAVSAILIIRGVQAGLLAMAAAAASVALVRVLPRHGFKILGILIALLLMTAPWVFGFLTQGADFATANDSSSYRAAIWQRVIALINEHPITGNGIGVLRTVRETIETGTFAGQFTVPNHAHNMLLQLWAETGAIGASLMSLAVILAGWRMGDAGRLGIGGLKAAALAGAMTAVAAVSFDLWNDWWWAFGGLLAILAVATPALAGKPRAAEPVTGLTFGETPATAVAAAPPAEAPAPADAHSHNNFNLLRLLFALMVAVYHAIALPGIAGWQQAEGWASLGAELGVQGFFVLSGYLVWASLERSPSLGLYAEKRARRLLPGYVAVVVACAIAAATLVPAVREAPLALASYLGWNLTFLNFMAPTLPGVFETNRFTEINGALWTLKIEVMFYLILPVLAFVLRVAGKLRWVLLALIYVSAELWRALLEQAGAAQGGIMIELARQLPGQMSFFITGIALCAWRDDINWRSLIAPVGILLLGLSVAFPQGEPLRAAGLGIVAVWIAVGWPRLFNAAAFGDLSYGLYIVHFPIIQCVIAAGLFGAAPSIGLAAVGGASFVAALLLWWLVERPALRTDSAYRSGR